MLLVAMGTLVDAWLVHVDEKSKQGKMSHENGFAPDERTGLLANTYADEGLLGSQSLQGYTEGGEGPVSGT